MSRWIFFSYGLLAYLSFLGVFALAAGFVGGLGPWKTVDGPPGLAPLPAVLVDVGLLLLFGLQHSVMARRGFKAWWTRIVPAPIERSTYVVASNLALGLVMLLWQPVGGVVWQAGDPLLRGALWSLFALGWLSVPLASLAIDHLELFGVKQVWRHLHGRSAAPVPFRGAGPYRLVRHPLYVAWLLAFWAIPTMTVGHLLFALGTTAYILVAIRVEERDLLFEHGTEYAAWRRATPMLVPRILPRRPRDPAPAGS